MKEIFLINYMMENDNMYGKWLVECMKSNGEWVKFNFFTCSIDEIREKCADILIKTNYHGVKYKYIKD